MLIHDENLIFKEIEKLATLLLLWLQFICQIINGGLTLDEYKRYYEHRKYCTINDYW
jgi:hypothetical protein